MDYAIELEGVSKAFGRFKAVDELSFRVPRGAMFGLLGPNGAGKTTTIRMICGLLHADAGHITVLGHDPIRDHRALTGKVGYLSQRFSLYGDLSIDENIAFFAEIHGVADYHARRDRLLDMTQLTKFRRRIADRLSGGMKQKLALACTLVHEPKLVVLDEPNAHLDAEGETALKGALKTLKARGATVIVVGHRPGLMAELDRIAVLKEGALAAIGEAAAVLWRLQGSREPAVHAVAAVAEGAGPAQAEGTEGVAA